MAEDNGANTLQPMDTGAPIASDAATTTTTSTTSALPTFLPNDILASSNAATGTLTPNTDAAGTPRSYVSDIPLSAEQRSLSLKVSLADLTARASHHYAQKHYDDAAEVYAQAAEMQAEMNGEMSPENAEILFLYGRSLFKVGQSKSDVLGGKAPATEGEGKKRQQRKKKRAPNGSAAVGAGAGAGVVGSSKDDAGAPTVEDKVAQEAGRIAADEVAKEGSKELEQKKPLFQFTGDENWDDSDGEDAEDGEGEGEDGEEEEDDDLATAFEILDLARVLLKKKLEEKLAAAEASEGKGKEVANGQADDAGIRHVKERLADTHDLLAEISLENERYPNAIADARESLKYQQQLLPEEHEIIAEAHFKLSLALEFASVTSQQDEESAASGAGPKEVNQELRDEAVKELAAAIASTKAKLQNKEVELATLHNPEDNEVTRKQISETKEIIADMEQRLVDLRGPPIDMQAALGGEAIGGLLGGLMGQPADETEARIEEAKKTATDLTGLVRKKNKPVPAAAAPPAVAVATGSSEGKRKAEDDVVTEDATKKPRTEETETSS